MASNYLYKREFVKGQREKGLCIECVNPVTNGIRCKKCYDRQRKWTQDKRAEWKKEKSCSGCGRECLSNKKVCEKCYLIKVSANRLGSGKYWNELKTLLEKQSFRCKLTGDKISFDNMELDHILPTTRKGKNELSNVRWVTKEANRLKQNLTDKELKTLCNKILLTI